MRALVFVTLAALAAFTFVPVGSGHHGHQTQLCLVLPVPGQFTPNVVLQGQDCQPRRHHHQDEDNDES